MIERADQKAEDVCAAVYVRNLARHGLELTLVPEYGSVRRPEMITCWRAVVTRPPDGERQTRVEGRGPTPAMAICHLGDQVEVRWGCDLGHGEGRRDREAELNRWARDRHARERETHGEWPPRRGPSQEEVARALTILRGILGTCLGYTDQEVGAFAERVGGEIAMWFWFDGPTNLAVEHVAVTVCHAARARGRPAPDPHRLVGALLVDCLTAGQSRDQFAPDTDWQEFKERIAVVVERHDLWLPVDEEKPAP